jgi:hypothetical protein
MRIPDRSESLSVSCVDRARGGMIGHVMPRTCGIGDLRHDRSYFRMRLPDPGAMSSGIPTLGA